MNTSATNDTQSTSWWIISLAISIVCCAILFVIFASYLLNIRDVMTANRIRLDVMDQRLLSLSDEVDYLRRKTTVQQIQILSSTPNTVPTEAIVQTLGGVPPQSPQQAATAPISTTAPTPQEAPRP